MSDELKPVLVVGAGPTGLMAAFELSRFGIPVRLIEKKREPESTSRAIGVQARTLELLEQRGLATSLVDIGNPAVAGSIYGDGKRLFRLTFDHIDSKYPYLLFVSQAETERTLREALGRAGVQIEWNLTLLAFGEADRDSKLTAILQHDGGALEPFECSYLIDAEGAHSTVRNTAGLQFQGKSLPEDYALGDLFVDGDLDDSDFHIFSSEHGFMALFPMGKRHFRLIASNPLSAPSKDTEPSLDELQQIYNQRSHIPAALRDMVWSSWFRINSRMVSHLRLGRAFLGGDAAHIHSPAGGQGMNTGMQDMINLSWKLAMVMNGDAKPELLDTYSADRIPVIRDVLTNTEGLTSAIGSENTLFRSVFSHITPWLVSLEAVQQNSTERLSQLALNYRDSPLSEQDGTVGALRAGDRMPDLPVKVLSNEDSTSNQPESTTTFQLLNPSMFTLVFCNTPDPAATHSDLQRKLGPLRHLINTHHVGAAPGDDRFKKYFGDAPAIILVRPDGYLAFSGTDKSVEKLAGYCAKWLTPQMEKS